MLLQRMACGGAAGGEAVWGQVLKGDRKRLQRSWKYYGPLRGHSGMCSAIEKVRQERVGLISESVIEKFQNVSQNSQEEVISGKWCEFCAECGKLILSFEPTENGLSALMVENRSLVK